MFLLPRDLYHVAFCIEISFPPYMVLLLLFRSRFLPTSVICPAPSCFLFLATWFYHSSCPPRFIQYLSATCRLLSIAACRNNTSLPLAEPRINPVYLLGGFCNNEYRGHFGSMTSWSWRVLKEFVRTTVILAAGVGRGGSILRTPPPVCFWESGGILGIRGILRETLGGANP